MLSVNDVILEIIVINNMLNQNNLAYGDTCGDGINQSSIPFTFAILIVSLVMIGIEPAFSPKAVQSIKAPRFCCGTADVKNEWCRCSHDVISGDYPYNLFRCGSRKNLSTNPKKKLKPRNISR